MTPRRGTGYVQSLLQALQSTLPKHLEFQDSGQPGPSNAIPNPPTVEVMGLQMTLTVKCKTKAIDVFLAGGNADPGLN